MIASNHASHLQVPIKNIERELICPICKELFTHPLILPCQHSICHKCVRELLMLNHEDSFDAGSECSMPGSPRSRVPSPSMERLDRLVRSGGSRGKEPKVYLFFVFIFVDWINVSSPERVYHVRLSAERWISHFSEVKSVSHPRVDALVEQRSCCHWSRLYELMDANNQSVVTQDMQALNASQAICVIFHGREFLYQ